MGNQLAGHGNPNGSLACAFAGQLYVDADTSNLFSSVGPAGNNAWNQTLQVGGVSAAFSGLVAVETPTNPGAVPWVVVNLAMLQSYIQTSYVTILNTKDLAGGQTDRFTQAFQDVTNEIRNTIASYKFGYFLSATPNSVPPELVRTTCYLIILAMQASCPEIVLKEEKRKLFEAAYKWVDAFSTGTRKPSMPTDPDTQAVQSLPGATVVRSYERVVTDHSMRGL